jgi:hypothetical protein
MHSVQSFLVMCYELKVPESQNCLSFEPECVLIAGKESEQQRKYGKILIRIRPLRMSQLHCKSILIIGHICILTFSA